MPGFLSELERQSYPDQSTNALADDFARQSATNPREFDKGLLGRILGEETASPAREQRTLDAGDFEVDPNTAPPYRYSPPRPPSAASLVSKVVNRIGPRTGDDNGAVAPLAATGPAAGPPVGRDPSPQEQLQMLLKLIQQMQPTPNFQGAATVPFQMQGPVGQVANNPSQYTPYLNASGAALNSAGMYNPLGSGVPSPQMRPPPQMLPPLSPYGNQFGVTGFPNNRFGGTRSLLPSPQFARGGFLRMMRGGYPADLMMGLPQRHNFGQGDYVQPDGRGDGRSDHVEARLSPGEFVIDAETTSMLGNGDNEAGARRLEEMRRRVRRHKGSALAKGKFSPDARSPEAYLNDSPRKRP